MPKWKSCKNLKDFEIFRMIESYLIKQSTLGQRRGKELPSRTFLNHQRCEEMPSFFKKLIISQNSSVKVFF